MSPALLLLAIAQTTSTAADDVDALFGGSDELYYELTSDTPKLSLYGFVDFSYAKSVAQERTPLSDLIARDSFAIGGLNLYLDGSLGSTWRSLAEVRVHYAPNGLEMIDVNSGGFSTMTTSYVDLNDFTIDTRWGGIEIERVWLEFGPYEWLQVRAGIWLTPYGIWNVDHGSPTIIGVRPPLLLQQALFPERQTGLQATGTFGFDTWTLRYAVTLSNGRGSFDGIRDLDGNKALGGRAAFEWTGYGQLSVGVSSYYGTHTAGERTVGTVDDPTRELPGFDLVISEQHKELSIAADVRYSLKGFLVQGELTTQQIAYEDGGRTAAVALPGQEADHINWGWYALCGYRTSFVGLMPYVMFEMIEFGAPQLIDSGSTVSLGVNARPDPAITLKLQYTLHNLSTFTFAGRDATTLSVIETQAAWAF